MTAMEALEKTGSSIPEKAMAEPGLKMFLYFSQLHGRPVIGGDGRVMGKLADLKVKLGEPFPRMSSLVLKTKRKKRLMELDWSRIESLNGNKITLTPGPEDTLKPLDVKPQELLLKEELLDKQVVDTYGAKIERVNDVHLLIINKDLHIVHVDFGVRGLIRRLGWLKAVDSFTMWFFGYRFPDKLISWKYVQPLAADLRNKDLKLNVQSRSIHDLHPSELADILEELDRANQSRIFKSLDIETAADTLEEMDDSRLQASLIESAPAEQASDILDEMAPDAATDLLADMPEDKQRKLIRTMEKPSREAVEELLKFKEGTAGSIMTKDFLSLSKDKTIGDAIEEFRKTTHPLESVSYIYVTNKEGHLVGVTTLRQLIICDKDTPLKKHMNPHLVKVGPEDDVEDVAKLFKKYKFMALPVVDSHNILQGIITLKDIIETTLD
ncbi:MAG: CBS domain-containing protein [Candidatus Aminicenantales bacterium]